MTGNLFVGEIVGTSKKDKRKKWRHWVVVHARFDIHPEDFNETILELHPEDYLLYDDYGELAWNDDHSGAKLIKAFKQKGLELYSVEPADLVYLYADKNW